MDINTIFVFDKEHTSKTELQDLELYLGQKSDMEDNNTRNVTNVEGTGQAKWFTLHDNGDGTVSGYVEDVYDFSPKYNGDSGGVVYYNDPDDGYSYIGIHKGRITSGNTSYSYCVKWENIDDYWDIWFEQNNNKKIISISFGLQFGFLQQ